MVDLDSVVRSRIATHRGRSIDCPRSTYTHPRTATTSRAAMNENGYDDPPADRRVPPIDHNACSKDATPAPRTMPVRKGHCLLLPPPLRWLRLLLPPALLAAVEKATASPRARPTPPLPLLPLLPPWGAGMLLRCRSICVI